MAGWVKREKKKGWTDRGENRYTSYVHTIPVDKYREAEEEREREAQKRKPTQEMCQ